MRLPTAAGSDPVMVELAFVVFASFAWGVRGHFVSGRKFPTRMRVLAGVSILTFAYWLTAIFAHHVPMPRAAAAGALILCAQALFWATIHHTRQAGFGVAYSGEHPAAIEQGGPFALVRHPFYTSYALFWLATAISAGGWHWIPALMLVGLYVDLAWSEERAIRRSGLAGDYRRYRERTGMFLPRFRVRAPTPFAAPARATPRVSPRARVPPRSRVHPHHSGG